MKTAHIIKSEQYRLISIRCYTRKCWFLLLVREKKIWKAF